MSEHDTPYMNGVGIMQKTRELIDKTWETVIFAIFGITAALFAPFVMFVSFLASGESWTLTAWCVHVGAAAIAVAGGISITIPWLRASKALSAHQKRMEPETAKRGKGWARS